VLVFRGAARRLLRLHTATPSLVLAQPFHALTVRTNPGFVIWRQL